MKAQFPTYAARNKPEYQLTTARKSPSLIVSTRAGPELNKYRPDPTLVEINYPIMH